MKKLFVLLLTFSLLLTGATMAMAAIHDSFQDGFINYATSGDNYSYTTGGGWFYVEKDDPFYQAVTTKTTYPSGSVFTQYAFEAWQNDQTFGEITQQNVFQDISSIRLNYLTPSGFFLGLDNDNLYTIISPGYLFDLNDNGYVAINMDYKMTQVSGQGKFNTTRDINGYELYSKIFGDNYKFFGQIYNFKAAKTTAYNFNLNYKVADTLVVGGQVARDAVKTNSALVGLTYSPDSLLFDLQVKRNTPNVGSAWNVTNANVYYTVSDNASIGLGYENDSSLRDVGVALEGKYKAFDGTFVFGYTLPTDYNYSRAFSLRFNKGLK